MSVKDFFVGRKLLQPIFERLFKLTLRGMNYGLGGMISTSGETYVMKLINRTLDYLEVENKTVFDVGANQGQYTEALLEIFAGPVKVYCFEPSASSFERLTHKVGNKQNVELVPVGLGDKSEKRSLYFDVEGSGWASVFERKDTGFNHPLHSSEQITMITLDEFCSSHGVERIHFLKADVEGFELAILKGSAKMLSNIDFIQFEFSFANYNSKTYLFDFFEVLSDFVIYRILKDGLEKIQYDPRYEILMTTNYLAVNKTVTKKCKIE